MTQKFKLIQINDQPYIRLFTKNWIIDISLTQVYKNQNNSEIKAKWLSLFTAQQSDEYKQYEQHDGIEYLNHFLKINGQNIKLNEIDFQKIEPPIINFIIR
ncbi:hypothetical protein [Spiroplasma endosymbiont of Amphibalanus improvisus]|uniref:hypothetical protein n=1 Tax=Spiroplasma endosymbiont of Amphibalanus improvisus TaxID=3066327 RepID=UPI00313C95C1